MRQSAELESQIVSVERLEEYAQIPSEAPPIVADKRPRSSWPEEGTIEFRGTSMR